MGGRGFAAVPVFPARVVGPLRGDAGASGLDQTRCCQGVCPAQGALRRLHREERRVSVCTIPLAKFDFVYSMKRMVCACLWSSSKEPQLLRTALAVFWHCTEPRVPRWPWA